MAGMNDKDYYAILGVEPTASSKEIQKAFQQKARKLHPDINKEPDAEERFKEVSEAYAVLSDDSKRARYDAMRSGNPFAASGSGQPAAGGAGFGGFPFTGFPFDASGFGRRRASSAFNPEEGADVVVDIELTREQSRDGARRVVTFRRYEHCSNCHGSGSVSSEHARTCPTCGGSGSIGVDLSSLFGMGAVQMVCPECGGSGKVVADPCTVCGATGRVAVTSEQVIEFPKDTHDGDVVRIPGMGHAGTNGAASGDLVARARVASERLEHRASTGFYVIGLALPFLILSAISGVFSLFAMICLVPLVFGVFYVATDDPLHRSLLWWKRGFAVAMNGAMNGLFFALLSVWFTSCTQGLFLSPYRMM